MGRTGRVAVMKAPRELEFQEFPVPAVAPGCILVRVTCCTICGSDLHTWLGRRPSPTPIILGHEIVGQIVELGDGVIHDSGNRPLGIGDRITWTIMDACGKCFYCREQGLPMKCLHLRKYGHDSCESPPHFVGGFGEYCYLTPGTCVVKVPAALPDRVVAPANCALATVVAAWEAARLTAGENVLILGAGALGLYAAALAAHAGCREVLVTDALGHRLAIAPCFGATDTLLEREEADHLVEWALARTEGFGVDAVLEVAGVPGLIPLGLKALRIGGRLIEVGNVFPGALATFDLSEIVFRWLTVRGVHNYDLRHLQRAVDFLAETLDVFPFASLVTEEYPLQAIGEALTAAEARRGVRVAVVP